MSIIRVIDLETAGSGPQDVCEIGWQDVSQDASGVWSLGPDGGAMFVNPGRPISPETMSVHHIADADVLGAPYWKVAAPNVLRPDYPIIALAAHRASFEQRFCSPRFSGGLPWICTWKCALRVWPNLTSFSNQMLRYQRMPEGLVRDRGLPAHRAGPDAYVTAHHLRDMLNAVPATQLLEWSREPGLLPRLPSGPDRGKAWPTLSADTLARYAEDRDVDIRFSARAEIARRGDTRNQTAEDPIQGKLL